MRQNNLFYKLFLFSLFLCFAVTVTAQSTPIKVSGVVLDQDKQPLSYVAIEIIDRGVKQITATNIDGEFSLTVNKDAVLKFSFLGMRTVEKTIKRADSKMIVILEDESTMLDQVVVMGYMTTTKRRSTGSVATMTEKDLKQLPTSGLDMKMQGKIAGVDIKAVSGQPGSTAKIRIRGVNTISGNAEPLWVVDGVPLERDVVSVKGKDLASIFANGVAGINPNDIENITVLKDASATAIYGSRAAGGVIVVTTKQGKAGKLRVGYSNNISVASAPPRSANLMTSKEKLAWEKELWEEFSEKRFKEGKRYPVIGIYGMAMAGKGIFENMSQEDRLKYLDKLSNNTTNWFDELFRTSISQGHFLSLSGGSDKQTFYASVGYDDNKGIEKDSYYNRVSFNGKYRIDVNKRVRVNIISDMAVQKSEGTAAAISPYQYAYFANPYERPYDENGQYAPDLTYRYMEVMNGGVKLLIPPKGFNVLKEMKENRVTARNFSGSLKGDISIKITDFLRFEGLASYSYSASYNDAITGKETYTAYIDRPFEKDPFTSKRLYGSISQSSSYNTAYNLRGQINFQKEFNKNFVSALFGSEVRRQHNKGIYTKRYDYDPNTGIASLPRPLDGNADYSTLNSYLSIMDSANGQIDTESALASFYFSADYSYRQKYVVSLTARTDGSSSFGTKEQFNPTGSLGFSWHVDKENFFEKLKPLFSSMSFRIAGGYTGNINKSIYPQLILDYSLFERRITNNGTYSIGTIKSPPNPNLRWEKTRDTKVSLDFGLLEERIRVQTELYDRRTTDAVTFSTIPSTTGFTRQSFNTSDILNQGVEVSVSATVLRGKDWSLFASGNMSYNRNKLIKFNAPSEDAQDGVYLGYPLNSLMTGKLMGIDPITGMYLFKKRSDANLLDDKDRQSRDNYLFYRGTSVAPINGGVSLSYTYKGISLHVGGSYSINGKVLNNITPPGSSSNLGSGKTESVQNIKNDLYVNHYNVIRDVTNRWTEKNPITNGYPRLIDAFGDKLYLDKYMPIGSTINNAALYENVSYFKIGSIMLSYSFNSNARILRQLGISSLGLSLSANNVAIFSNYTGLDPETPGAIYPMARSYTFGLNVDF